MPLILAHGLAGFRGISGTLLQAMHRQCLFDPGLSDLLFMVTLLLGGLLHLAQELINKTQPNYHIEVSAFFTKCKIVYTLPYWAALRMACPAVSRIPSGKPMMLYTSRNSMTQITPRERTHRIKPYFTKSIG